jgi:hypothetical protein
MFSVTPPYVKNKEVKTSSYGNISGYMKNHTTQGVRSKKLLTSTVTFEELTSEIIELFNILRDGEFQDECEASNHTLKLCAFCNADINDVLRRIKKIERPFQYLSKSKSDRNGKK